MKTEATEQNKNLRLGENFVFLVIFRGDRFKYVFHKAEDFLNLLKAHEYGIEKILMFDQQKNSFKRVGKAKVKAVLRHNTELRIKYFEKLEYWKTAK
jgi:hypothetical protein